MSKIILSTLNAKYIHAAIGLRYLVANLKELEHTATIQEYTLNDHPTEIAEKILAVEPVIVGLAVYIWNVAETQKLVRVLKKVAPQTVVVLGGPEVSHLPMRIPFDEADYIIQGEGENSFYTLCQQLLSGHAPRERVIGPTMVDLDRIELPYAYYSEHDIARRVLYVEASRGCPFSCEFCLSSIDKTVRYFDLDRLLAALEDLWQRGGRKFKFVDRTFNLNLSVVERLLDYFLAKEPPYFIHFEVIPDHFPQTLQSKLKKFQPGVLQLEVGIQTLNSEIAHNINRKLHVEKIKENLIFLEQETGAHLHIDLIIGLPGEPVESFGANLNRLTAMTRGEIQLGILKKLSGTAINRHDHTHRMVYSDYPPYEILENDLIPFAVMQSMKRFARFWNLTYNSGNFNQSVRLIWHDTDVYSGFLHFSSWIYNETASTWKISLNRLAELLFRYLIEMKGINTTRAADTIAEDILKINGRALPRLIRDHATVKPGPQKTTHKSLSKRQQRHL